MLKTEHISTQAAAFPFLTSSMFMPNHIFRTPGLMLLGISLIFVLNTRAADAMRLLTTIHPSLPPRVTPGGDSFVVDVTPGGDAIFILSSAQNLLAKDMCVNPGPAVAPMNLYLRSLRSNTTILVTANSQGIPANSGVTLQGYLTNLSKVLFESDADNLSEGDTNEVSDVFVRDLASNTTVLVSRGLEGEPASGDSRSSVISADGRYVAFVSDASNLVFNDTNGIPDVFLHDLVTHTTTLVSFGARPYNKQFGGASESPRISADGRYVAFYSTATNLAPGVPYFSSTERESDIYLRDAVAATTMWVSQGARALLGGSNMRFSFNHQMSLDGRHVAFQAARAAVTPGTYALGKYAPSLILRFDVTTASTQVIASNAVVSTVPREDIADLAMTPDGNALAFLVTTNVGGRPEEMIVAWNAVDGTTALVSGTTDNAIPPGGRHEWPVLDNTGRYVLFLSDAAGLVTNQLSYATHLFLRDLQSQTTVLQDELLAGGAPGSGIIGAVMSADARIIAFDTQDSVGPGDANQSYDVLVRTNNGVPALVSMADTTARSSTPKGYSSMSPMAAGRDRIVFQSTAVDLVSDGGVAGFMNVYVADLRSGLISRVSTGSDGMAAGNSYDAQISADGTKVVFESAAENLLGVDTNRASDVFWKDLASGEARLVSISTNGVSSGNRASHSAQISKSGRYVLFLSAASDVAVIRQPVVPGSVCLFLRDMQSGTTTMLNNGRNVYSYSFSGDERFVAYVAAHTYLATQLRVWDIQAKADVYTNASAGLTMANISPDGKLLAYWAGSGQSLLLLENLETHSTNQVFTIPARISSSDELRFSPDNSRLAFTVGGQVYLAMTSTGTNYLVTRGINQMPGNDRSEQVTFSPDGKWLAFSSSAENLVTNDTNGWSDVFLHNLSTNSTKLVSLSRCHPGAAGELSMGPVFTSDSSSLAFVSWATDIVPNDFNNGSDIFIYELPGSPARGPHLTISRNQGNLMITWIAKPGSVYAIQTADVSAALELNWRPAPGAPMIVGSAAQYTVSDLSGTARFYRVVELAEESP